MLVQTQMDKIDRWEIEKSIQAGHFHMDTLFLHFALVSVLWVNKSEALMRPSSDSDSSTRR